jgi:hypothetical protein
VVIREVVASLPATGPRSGLGTGVREGAWVAELTGLLDLARNNWPAGMRVIARKERRP